MIQKAYILLRCDITDTYDTKQAAMNSHTKVQFEHFKENKPSSFHKTFSHTASTKSACDKFDQLSLPSQKSESPLVSYHQHSFPFNDIF